MTVETSPRGPGGRGLIVDYLDRYSSDLVARWTDRVLSIPSVSKRLARIPRPTHEAGLGLLFSGLIERLGDSDSQTSFQTLTRLLTEGYLADFEIGDVILYLAAVRDVVRDRLGDDPLSTPVLGTLENEVDRHLAWAAEAMQQSRQTEWLQRQHEIESRQRGLDNENDRLQEENRDVRRTIEQLRDVVERYRALSESASDGIFVIDPESYLLVETNGRFEQMTEHGESELAQLNVLRLVDAEDVAGLLGTLDEVVDSGHTVRRALRFKTPSGSRLVFEVSFGRVTLEDGRVLVHAIAREQVTEAVSTPTSPPPVAPGSAEELILEDTVEPATQPSSGGVELLWAQLPAPAFLARTTGEILEINEAAAALLDRDERAPSRTVADACAPSDRPILTSLLQSGGYGMITTATGRPLALLVLPFVGEGQSDSQVLGVLADRSEDALEGRQEQQARHMESLGRIAGGVAHDFNNFLSSILGYASLIKSTLAEHDPNHGRVAKLEKAALYAASLVQDLLFLGRKTPRYDLRWIDPNHAVRETAKQLRRSLPDDIEIHHRLSEGLPKIEVDPKELQRALIHLGRNAADAMETGGQIVFRTSRVPIGDHERAGGFVGPLPPRGAYLVFSVADTGPGIAASDHEHLFEAYFSSKETGTGNGLGLATVYKIVRDHGGFVRVDSDQGNGTVVMLLFPIHEKDEPSETEESAKQADLEKAPGGSETILVAEDDQMVRDMVTEVLGRYGYRTVTAENGQEALDLYRAGSVPIDLVFLDVDMPLMDGLTAYKELRGLDPKVKVILTTGFGKQGQLLQVVEQEQVAFLPKPCRQEELLKKIRDVLDGRTPTA